MSQAPAVDGVQASDLYRLSVDQYHRMISPGILESDDPVELLEGLLVHKSPPRSSDATLDC